MTVMRVGLISDTHGKLRPEVFEHFAGVARILHAGDVGPAELLDELETIAPVHAVFGNTDGPEVQARCPATLALEVGGFAITITHGHLAQSLKPEALRAAFPRADIIMYGHTHRPLVQMVNECLVVNPGGAGAPRFGLRPSVGILELERGTVPRARVIEL